MPRNVQHRDAKDDKVATVNERAGTKYDNNQKHDGYEAHAHNEHSQRN